MSTHRYLYLHNVGAERYAQQGKIWVNIHYLVGYNQGSIVDHEKARKIMEKEIGVKISPKDVHCGKVFKSRCVSGFTITTWNGLIPIPSEAKKKELEDKGWYFLNEMEYCW